ncbi:MAG: peroxide stress protein YaaA [Bacteroidales bacterium]|nr:peroxide stress protein YaaA [Bacteroidales bacterium]
MLIVISPAKSLDKNAEPKSDVYTMPDYMLESERIVRKMKKCKPVDLQALMGVSYKLAHENYDRYQAWSLPFTLENSRQAVLFFKGDVYLGMKVESFSEDDYEFAQKHLRILSGLYGILRPMDLIQPYRLEMGTNISVLKSKNLYEYWTKNITNAINKQLEANSSEVLINLASNEYFKSIDQSKLTAKIITPEFKDRKNGHYKMVSFFAKKARGMMTRYIIQNRISDPEQLKLFNEDGYSYNEQLSKEDKLVFTREELKVI